MPYFNEGNRSPCAYQKKTSSNAPYHVIPITKRPIEKVTTRSQTQIQQLIKSMGADILDANKADRNNNIGPTKMTNFVSDKVTSARLRAEVAYSRGAAAAKQQQQQHRPQMSDEEIHTGMLHITPQRILSNRDTWSHLTAYERKEITNYSRIYYIGNAGIKKRTPQTATVYTGPDGFETKVYGFDDNNGSYITVVHDHIAYRYEVLNIIGKGTFGVVLQAFDHKTQQKVALKVIRNQARFHTQAKEEIKILTKLLDNDAGDKFNVVHMYDNFMFRNHPCIVFELLSLNLYELSKKNSFKGFNLSLIRRFTYAIVKCLEALSRFDIIHCDLKPENILLKQHNRSGIKVVDFGSSCFANERIHTYIQSRYYRAPEVILNGKYGPPIDMWSLGCILVELFNGRPLLDGDNENDQLSCMLELLNTPSRTFLSKCKQSKVRQFFDNDGFPTYYHQRLATTKVEGQRTAKYRGPPGTRKLLPTCNDTDFIDFVSGCLVWDPSERLTPGAARDHPWLSRRGNGLVTPSGLSNHNELSSDMVLH